MRVGILGSMVWDRIDHPDGPPVERWGGIAYALAAAVASAPDGWSIRPIVKVGRDLEGAAHRFFEALPGVDVAAGIQVASEPNNRVHLRYRDRHHRDEHLTGGVGPWSREELAPGLDGLDALYVNLISGFELTLDVARWIRTAVPPPLYADLHSLLLGVDATGKRVPRPLEHAAGWLDAFDLVQVNERELALVAGDGDPDEVVDAAVRRGLVGFLITRGPAGATVVTASGSPRPWAGRPGPVRWADVPPETVWEKGDPTGCGDVWGATCFMTLLRGAPLEEAARLANRAASRNVGYRGADGLHAFLTEGL
jgi:sugar/nucleoside kinase (ribokinase family)